MTTTILRLPRTDKTGQTLLVHITPNPSHSDRSLDLNLIGTEHEHLYHYNLTSSTLTSLQPNQQQQSQTGPTSTEDLHKILLYTLLHQPPTPATEALTNLETVAAIKASTLTITIRKSHSGITHPVLRIPLTQDDEREEVSPFDWVDTAVSASDALRDELRVCKAELEAQRGAVQGLEERMEELVRVKREGEREMVAKFVRLLNGKKAKIRELLRLVNAGETGGVGRSAESAGRGRGRGKRKADVVEEQEDEVEMRDAQESEEDENDVQQETPPRTDDEETEDEDLDGPVKAPDNRVGGKAAESARSGDNDAEMLLHEPPPRRELPATLRAAKPTTRAATAAATQDDENDDDDETDDEDDLDAPVKSKKRGR